jgi:hypothetical protein
MVLGNGRRNIRLIKPVTCSQNLGWVLFANEEVDHVEETRNAVVVVRSNRKKSDRYITGDANRVLSVQVLWMIE